MTFAGIIIIAPFSSLPSLLLTYRIGGLLPILLPLRPFPYIAGLLTSRVSDPWLSAERLAAYYNAVTSPDLLADSGSGRGKGSLQVVHSTRDMDIPYHQTEMICRRIFGEGREPGVYEGGGGKDEGAVVGCIDGSKGAAVLDVQTEGRVKVRFEILEYGGEFATLFPARRYCGLAGEPQTKLALNIDKMIYQTGDARTLTKGFGQDTTA